MLLSELAVVRAAHVVLACGSAHRQALLNDQFSLHARSVAPSAALPDGDYVDRAQQNALEVFQRSAAPFLARHGRQPSLIIGVDTVVCVNGRALGKPTSVGEARDMLTELAAAGTHTVKSGVSLVYGDPAGGPAPATVQTFVEETTVQLDANAMGAADIEAYVASGEPMKSPGGYCVQGLGSAFASSVVGDHMNAAYGFPLHRFLSEVDVALLRAWINAIPEEALPASAAMTTDRASLDDMEPPPGIVCEDDECGLPSD